MSMATDQQPDWATLEPGARLPPLTAGPITRQMLAIYCGASGDHNPIHVDIDFARQSGLDDVIAHGMFVMATSGRLLTGWIPQPAVRSFNARFLAPTRVGDEITVTGTVEEKLIEDGEQRVRIQVEACDQTGEAKIKGSALVAVSETAQRGAAQ